ncbi:MAG: hypothetical protein HY040_14995 [Planctomycetes bacterium]|nr:hypothetical protein [Planctomycetota bacterium]
MGCDMVVALGPATVNGQVLFGMNRYAHHGEKIHLRRLEGRIHAPGETVTGEAVTGGSWSIPEARQTLTVLGCQPTGAWGFTCGLNESHVAVGVASWKSKLPAAAAGLSGIEDASATNGAIFLIADGREALLVEAAGTHWGMLDAHQVRAVSDVALIRQDWQRLAPGLGELAISRGWWPDGGSKLDFAGSLSRYDPSQAWALKRWGRATLLLEQQNGHIDYEVLRRLLAEHYESAAPYTPAMRGKRPGLVTFLAALSPEANALPVAWCGVGTAAKSLYFPVLIDGELPEILRAHNGPGLAPLPAIDNSESLQARWDGAIEDFVATARRQRHGHEPLHRQATQLMHLLAAGLVPMDQLAGMVRQDTLRAAADELAFVSE